MGGGTVLVPAPQPAQQQPEGPAGDGVRGVGDGPRVDGQPPVPGGGPVRHVLGQTGEAGLVRPEEGGGVHQTGGKAGGHVLQHREDLVADAVAGVIVVVIGAVLHVGQAPEAEVVLHLPAAGGEKGADDALPPGGDAPQAPQAGPPGQMEEDGFHIVIGGVGGGDEAGPRFRRRTAEKGVAHVPGSLLNAPPLDAGLSGHVAGVHVQGDGGEHAAVGQAVPPAAQVDKLVHKGGVPVGLLPPQLMVVVGGGQLEVQLGPQAVQDVEHGNGVRPPGHGAQHLGPGGDQVLLPNKVFNGFQQ